MSFHVPLFCFFFSSFLFFSFVVVHVKRHREKEKLPGKLISRERMARPVTLESKFGNALFPLKKVFEKERALRGSIYRLDSHPLLSSPLYSRDDVSPRYRCEQIYPVYDEYIFIDNAILARAEAFLQCRLISISNREILVRIKTYKIMT